MNRTERSGLSEAAKIRVCQLVESMPGLKSREIAQRLGIADRRELNRFLYAEGKGCRGLFVRTWRWYHSGVDQPGLPSLLPKPGGSMVDRTDARVAALKMSGPQPIASRTLCGVLAGMNELDAIRQIRRLDRLAIEKAFSEDEYSALADVLKIELVRRLEELKAMPALPRIRMTWPLKMLAIAALVLVLIVMLAEILD